MKAICPTHHLGTYHKWLKLKQYVVEPLIKYTEKLAPNLSILKAFGVIKSEIGVHAKTFKGRE
jgi:hypothetical protein